MSNNIEALRDHLFRTLEGLADKENPMDIERAKAINDTAQTLINSAKVEVDLIKATGGLGSEFLTPVVARPGLGQTHTSSTINGSKTITQLPSGAVVTRHKLQG